MPVSFISASGNAQRKSCLQLDNQSLQIGMYHIYTAPVRRVQPVHVPNDIPRQSYLFNPGNPLIYVWNHWQEQVSVSAHDLVQLPQCGVVDIVASG
jgi:hypothetical protein